MSKSTDPLLQQLFRLPALHNSSIDDLQRITEQFPYFSAAQLLLYKRLQLEHRDSNQKQKAALHVYHPLQLETLLDNEILDFDLLTETAPVVAEEASAPVADAEPVAVTEVYTTAPEAPVEEQNINESVQEVDNIELEASEQVIEQKTIPEVATPVTAVPPAEPKFPSFSLPTPADDKSLALTFEPFHTVDYFASQGIKLSKTEATNDHLGKQLKSFTEWLKTMKKLPATAITSNTDGVGERRVESLAAHSLQTSDVVTESMAEVWIKQGNFEKASEVYNKLSLQNPSKKAYFAAKIENLKKPN